jgi:uncharacterized membrane protein
MAKSELEKKLGELDGLRAKGVVTEEEYASRREALLSDTTVAQAKGGSKAGGIFKWGMMGCLGMFAAVGLFVVVVFALLAAAIGGSADDTEDSGGDVRVALANGAVGEISAEHNGDERSKVTILQVVDNAQSTNQFIQPAEGKKWVGFEVEIENVGSEQASSLDWTLQDSKSLEHDRRFVTTAGEDLDVIYTDLSPGAKRTGWVFFEIDADASVRWLRADPNPVLAHDLYFDAQ